MRTLVVSSSFPRRTGDHAGRFVLDLSMGLSALGDEVVHVAPWEGGCPLQEELSPGVSVERFKYAPAFMAESVAYGDGIGANLHRRAVGRLVQVPGFLRQMRRAVAAQIAKGAFDRVLSHWLVPGAWAAVKPAERMAVPHYAVSHGGDVHALGRLPLGGRLTQGITSRTRHVFFVSEDLRRKTGVILDRRGAPMPESSIVPMGVDLKAHQSGSGDALRRKWSVDGEIRLLVLGVGRMIPLKGFDVLIRAASQVEGVHLVLVGDGPERQSLERLSQECNAGVSFVGAIQGTDLPDFYDAADVVCIPSRLGRGSRSEGHPMVLSESMASGTCVVASRTGGLTEALEGKGGGLLFEPEDICGLSSLLRTLLLDRAYLQRLSAEANARGPGFDRLHTAKAVHDVMSEVGYTPHHD